MRKQDDLKTEIESLLYNYQQTIGKEGSFYNGPLVRSLLALIEQWGIEQRIEELSRFPKYKGNLEDWEVGDVYRVFTQDIPRRMTELTKLKQRKGQDE